MIDSWDWLPNGLALNYVRDSRWRCSYPRWGGVASSIFKYSLWVTSWAVTGKTHWVRTIFQCHLSQRILILSALNKQKDISKVPLHLVNHMWTKQVSAPVSHLSQKLKHESRMNTVSQTLITKHKQEIALASDWSCYWKIASIQQHQTRGHCLLGTGTISVNDSELE